MQKKVAIGPLITAFSPKVAENKGSSTHADSVFGDYSKTRPKLTSYSPNRNLSVNLLC